MNKRQAKKRYKKVHGYNPPSERQLQAARRKVYEAYHVTPEQIAATLTPEQIAAAVKAAKIAFAAAARAFAEIGERVNKTFTAVAESIESEV